MNILRSIILTVMLMLTAVNVTFAQTVSGEEVELVAVAKIHQILDERGDIRRREIQFLRQVSDANVPDGSLELEAVIPGQINYTGLTSVSVRYKINGRTCKMINVTVQVRVYDTALIPIHDLLYDKPISESDFRLDEIAIDGRNEFVKDFAEIKDLVPLRMLRAGVPVTVAMFQTAQVIEVNQPVRIRINYHGVMASAKGIAMSRGRVGKMIRVKNESSGKIVTGKVIDAHTVEVIY